MAEDVRRLGTLYGFDGGNYAGQVFDKNGLAPTFTDMQGGGRQPHIIECKKVGNVYGEQFTGGNYGGNVWNTDGLAPKLKSSGSAGQEFCLEVRKMNKVETIGNLYPDNKHQSSNVYGTNGLAPNIMAGTHGYGIGFVTESQIVRSVGRNPDNPSDRTKGAKLEQRLEPNSEGICNTLTSVSKDNLVLETDIINPLADCDDVSWQFAQNVYSEESKLIRAIKAGGGSGNIPKIIKIRQATKDGFIDCELPGVADLNYPSSDTRRGRVIERGQVSPTLTTENIPSLIELGDPDFYNFLYEIDGEIFLIRIRKLIPKESWSLMNFNEGSFEKAAEVNSNTQLYKQAGNSIVVNVLVAIIGQMLEGKEDVYKEVV